MNRVLWRKKSSRGAAPHPAGAVPQTPPRSSIPVRPYLVVANPGPRIPFTSAGVRRPARDSLLPRRTSLYGSGHRKSDIPAAAHSHMHHMGAHRHHGCERLGPGLRRLSVVRQDIPADPKMFPSYSLEVKYYFGRILHRSSTPWAAAAANAVFTESPTPVPHCA